MYVHHLNYGPPKVSGAGIASCILAGVAMLFVAGAALLMAAGRLSGGAGGPPTTDEYVLGFAMMGSFCGGGVLMLAGLVTGIVGAAMPNRRVRVAVVGLSANGLLLAFMVLMLFV